jgi:hypothetical protein
MVDVDTLACLDYLIWLRTGDEVAKRTGFNQSTISRNLHKCCETFGLNVKKINNEYEITSDPTLINLERRVHQYHRWQGHRPLRIEGMFWSGRSYLNAPIDGFALGNHDVMDVSRPLNMLREGVLDAWIAPFPDAPTDDDADLATYPLAYFPCHLTAIESHPLFAVNRELTLEDIRNYPSLALPSGAFPVFENYAKSLGLWNSLSNMFRYDVSKWEGRNETEMTTTFSSIFALSLFAATQKIIPFKLHQPLGDILVVKRAFADRPQVDQLRHILRSRLLPWAEKYPEIRVCSDLKTQLQSSRITHDLIEKPIAKRPPHR